MTFNYQQVPGGGQDDVLNASGLSAPAIIRGTVYAHLTSGLIMGAGQTTGVRQTNATALQNAINYAASHNKFFEVEPGTYEINSSTGLLIPATSNYGLKLVGSKYGSIISQFYATTPGAPVLTVGDITSTNISNGVDISGLTLQYGAAQTGFTSASPLVVGYCANGHISDIFLNGVSNPGIDGVQFINSQQSAFNLALRDLTIVGFQRHGINYAYNNTTNATGTHVSFFNLYLAASQTGTRTAVTGNYLFLNNSPASLNFVGCTFAWGGTNIMVSSSHGGARSLNFNGLHIEGLQLIGAGPVMFDMAQTSIQINSMEMVNVLIITTGSALTGSPYMFQDFSVFSSNVKVDGFSWQSNAAGDINTPFGFLNATALGDDATHLEISNGHIYDDSGSGGFVGNLFFDAHTPVANFAYAHEWTRYTYGATGSRIERPVIQVSATYTHYGQYEDAVILIPTAITSFTLTMGTTQGATGTQTVRSGNTACVRRITGTASGTLTVTGLTAPNTGGTNNTYAYGTSWANVTPVT